MNYWKGWHEGKGVKLLTGYATNTAALYNLTENRGPYHWWGIVIGKYFFGIMKCKIDGKIER